MEKLILKSRIEEVMENVKLKLKSRIEKTILNVEGFIEKAIKKMESKSNPKTKKLMLKAGITIAMTMVMVFQFSAIAVQACSITFGEEELPEKLRN